MTKGYWKGKAVEAMTKEELVDALVSLAEFYAQDVCEWCGGTGVTNEDEYENGQCVGRGTIERKCICRMKSPDDDIEPE